MRTAQVHLTRTVRHRKSRKMRNLRKLVRVRQITVGRFIQALGLAAARIQEYRIKVTPELGDHDVWMALSHQDLCSGIAEVLCPKESRGWWGPWHSAKNVAAMLEGARAVDDWSRLLSVLPIFSGARENPAAAPPGGGGKGASLMSDVLIVAREFGVDPAVVLGRWTMEHFVSIRETLIASARADEEREMARDPLLNPNAEPTPMTPERARALGGRFTTVH